MGRIIILDFFAFLLLAACISFIIWVFFFKKAREMKEKEKLPWEE